MTSLKEAHEAEKKQESDFRTEQETRKQKPGNKVFLPALFVFAAALLTALSFHFLYDLGGPKRTLCFDARQYLADTSQIAELIRFCLQGNWLGAGQSMSKPDFVSAILADGPVLPSVFASMFVMTGQTPGIEQCRFIQVIQSLMHASSSLLLFLLSLKITGKKTVPALAAGLAWAAYPAAIYWSGIYYSETCVVFFSLLFLYFLSKAEKPKAAFCGGIFAGLLALLKPALLPAAALSSLLSLKISKKTFLLLALGLALAIAPWAVYTKAVTGTARFTAQRYPAFNFAMGADREVDACLVSPPPPLTSIFSHDEETPFAFPLSQWQFHTAESLRLAAYKLSCLWLQQANDFRQGFFGITCYQQNLWHKFLLWLGLSGLFLYMLSYAAKLVRCKKSPGLSEESWEASVVSSSAPDRLMANSAMLFLLSHFCYVLFTPAARYGLTAMPFLLIFAAYIISQAAGCFKSAKLRLVFFSFSLSSTCLAALFFFSSLSGGSQMPERAITLAKGDTIVKTIELSTACKFPEKINASFLLIDAEKEIENALISFNGHELPSGFKHLSQFNSRLYEQAFELRSLLYPYGKTVSELRHWRAVEIPASLLKGQGKNEILVRLKQESKVYGDPSATRLMLSPDYFAVNKLPNSLDSLDLRVVSPVKSANIKQESFVIPAAGSVRSNKAKAALIDSPVSLRLKLVLACARDSNQYTSKGRKEPSTSKGLQNANRSIPPAGEIQKEISYLSFDPNLQDPTIKGIRNNRFAMKAARSSGTLIPLESLPPGTHLDIKLEGELRTLGGRPTKAEPVMALEPALHCPSMVLNLSPELIQTDSQWQKFKVEDSVPRCLLKPGKTSVYVAFYPGRWLDFCGYPSDKSCADLQVRNLRVSICGKTYPDLAGLQLFYY